MNLYSMEFKVIANNSDSSKADEYLFSFTAIGS